MSLDYCIGIQLINKCFYKEEETFAKQLYSSLFPDMIRPNGFNENPMLKA